MKFKPVHIQFLLAFIMFLQPVAIFAQYIEAEISITISGSTYFPSKSNFKDVITEKTTIQGRVPGEIVRRRVEGYVKNPETRITECDASTYCPVITGSSEFAVRNDTNYAIVISDKLYPLYVQKSITSKGYRFINKKTGNIEEKIVKTENFSASGENNVEGLSLNISAFHAPSGQIAPLVPGYVMKVSGGKYLSRIRETPVGDGEWLRWDDEKETLSPENQPLGIGIPYLIADPSHELFDNEIYDQLLIRNYRQLDTFMLDPADKIFVIQASGKRYLKSDYSEYEGQIEVSINLAPFGFMRKPTVEIIGCTEIGAGEESVVTAKASKEGGSYRFWAEPQEMFSIEANGSTATIRGSSHGRGKLFVEYVSADGKKAEASKVAACIQLETYNGGQKIPQIALFDIDGKKLDGILNVPVEIKPNDAADLLSYVPANLAVLTAVGLGDVVTIQGVLPGKTTIQATTNCGATTGPAVEVEVVNCDDETIARLAEMMRLAKEEQKRAAEEIEEILGSKEFEKAANDIAKSTYDLAEKTALLIMSTSGASGAAKTASDILSAAAALKDFANSENDMEKSSNGLQILVAQLGSDVQQAVAGLTETLSAAGKFGINLGTLMATNICLKGAAEVYEQANRQIINISLLQNICKKGNNAQQNLEQPTANSEKPKTSHAPGTETNQKPDVPKTEPEAKSTPKTEDSQGQNAESGEPTAEDEILIDPELPPIPARQVGLPYDSGDCGCENTHSISTIKEGLTSMQNGMERLNECVDNFSKGPLTEYLTTLNDWTTLAEKLEKVVSLGTTGIESATKESVPVIESLLVRTKSFDNAGKSFLEEFKACPGSMKSGVEVLNSVNIITVDSLKVKY